MKSRRRLERFSLNWSRSIAVSMARKTSGPRMSAKIRSFARVRATGAIRCWPMLADEAGQNFLKQSSLPPRIKQRAPIPRPLCGNEIERAAQNFVPLVRDCLLERIQRAMMFCRGHRLPSARRI